MPERDTWTIENVRAALSEVAHGQVNPDEVAQWLDRGFASYKTEAERYREALETIIEIGETRDVQVARSALAARRGEG